MRYRSVLIAAAFAVTSLTPAHAAILVFKTVMTGPAERPLPVNSPGTGTSTVVVDTASNRMRVSAEFSDLLSPTTVAHIHCCAGPEETAGVATTTPTFPGFPAGVTSGSYDRVFNLLASGTYRAGFIANNGGTVEGARDALLAGLDGFAYFNIHSEQFPAGEIRGQFAAFVPEPGGWALMIAGFGLAGAAVRRRGGSAAFA